MAQRSQGFASASGVQLCFQGRRGVTEIGELQSIGLSYERPYLVLDPNSIMIS